MFRTPAELLPDSAIWDPSVSLHVNAARSHRIGGFLSLPLVFNGVHEHCVYCCWRYILAPPETQRLYLQGQIFVSVGCAG